MIQSVEDTPCPVSEAECRVGVAIYSSRSGSPMLGLGDNVPLGAKAFFERIETIYQVIMLYVGVITKFLHDGVGPIRVCRLYTIVRHA